MQYSKTYLAGRVRIELSKTARKFRFLAISEKKPGNFRMRCPNPGHKAGRERTPSLWVDINLKSKYFFRFRCYGCGWRGDWSTLAPYIKCDLIVDPSDTKGRIEHIVYDEEAIALFDETSDRKLLGTDTIEMPDGLLWPSYTPWRTISGETIAAVNGVIFIDDKIQEDMLAFPVNNPDGTSEGFVKANIEPKPGGVNYFNATGMASTRCLLFADIAAQMISDLNDIDPKNEYARIAFISEGPRDALTPLMYGWPSVSNLGAINSWTADKVNLLLAIGIDLLISCMDSDQPGIDATDKIAEDVADLIDMHSILFPNHTEIDERTKKPKLVKDKDLSDLNAMQTARIVATACAVYNKRVPPIYDWNERRYLLPDNDIPLVIQARSKPIIHVRSRR